MSAILNFVHENTDLPISEDFFQQNHGPLLSTAMFTFGLPRPELLLYGDHLKWLYNDPTIPSTICIFFYFIIHLIFI